MNTVSFHFKRGVFSFDVTAEWYIEYDEYHIGDIEIDTGNEILSENAIKDFVVYEGGQTRSLLGLIIDKAKEEI